MTKQTNPHRAGEWRRILSELVDDLRLVAEDEDTPEEAQRRLAGVLCELVVLAHRKEGSYV